MFGAVRRRMVRRGKRLVAGLIAALAALIAVTAPATPAHADGLALRHVCTDIGNYNGTHAIICSDLYFNINMNTGDIIVWLDVEAYCQNGPNYPQCADIQVSGGVYGPGSNTSGYQWTARCGHSNPANCVSGGRNYFPPLDPYTTLPSWYFIPNGQCDEVWGVTWGGPGDTYIDLPGPGVQWRPLSGNLGTGHVKLGAC